MVNEAAITRPLLGGVYPHGLASVAELEHEPHGPFRRGEILLFTLLLVHEVPRVVADYFRRHEWSCRLDASPTVWEVFDDLKTIPGLGRGKVCQLSSEIARKKPAKPAI